MVSIIVESLRGVNEIVVVVVGVGVDFGWNDAIVGGVWHWLVGWGFDWLMERTVVWYDVEFKVDLLLRRDWLGCCVVMVRGDWFGWFDDVFHSSCLSSLSVLINFPEHYPVQLECWWCNDFDGQRREEKESIITGKLKRERMVERTELWLGATLSILLIVWYPRIKSLPPHRGKNAHNLIMAQSLTQQH